MKESVGVGPRWFSHHKKCTSLSLDFPGLSSCFVIKTDSFICQQHARLVSEELGCSSHPYDTFFQYVHIFYFTFPPAPLLLLTHVMCLLRPRAKKRGLRNGNGSDAQVCKTIDFLLSALKSIKINSDFTSWVRGESAWREKSTVVARKKGEKCWKLSWSVFGRDFDIGICGAINLLALVFGWVF